MEKTIKLISSTIALIVILAIIAPFANAATEPAVPANDNMYKSTKSLSVQKLQYKKALTDENKVSNDGRNFGQFNDVLEAYDKSKYGDVTFGLYLVEDGDLDEAGNLVAGYDYSAKESLLDADVDDKGLAKFTFDNAFYEKLAAKGITFDKHFKIVIAEKAPAKEGYLIAQKAEPMVVELPLQDATGVIEDIKITAKNQVKDGEVTILKKDENDNIIDNTLFDLYKGTADKNTLVKGDLTLTGGKVEIKGLGMGHYFLVEKPSENVSDLGITAVEDGKNYMLSEALTMNANNIVGFTVDANGVKIDTDENDENNFLKREGDDMVVTNYSVPTLKKENVSFENAGGEAVYKLTFTVPKNIFEYEKYDIEDTLPSKDYTLKADSIVSDVKANVTATQADEKLTFDFDEASLKAKAGQEVTLTYTINMPETANGEIENKAKLVFKKLGGKDTTSKITTSKINLYEMKVETKENITNKPLAGGKFVVIHNGKYYVKANEWTDDESQAKVFETVMEDGKAVVKITGLKEGTYETKLVEQPEGYKMLLGHEVNGKAEIGEGKTEKDGTVVYLFSKIFSLPKTGNYLIISIVAIIVISGVTYVVITKKQEKELTK